MKILLERVVLIALVFGWMSVATVSSSIANAQTEVVKSEVNIQVNGMVCSFCSNTLEKLFKEKSEVSEVRVDMDAKNIHVVFKETKNLSDEEIKKIVTDAGYTVVEVKR